MTQEVDKKTPVDRLDYSGDLRPVVERLSAAYSVGALRDFSVIGVGYEDCNIVVEAEGGKFVAKIFQEGRKSDDITRYATVMEKAIGAGVNHPSLLKTQSGEVVHRDNQANGLNLVLMKFIEGQTFFELRRVPDEQERQAILEQAVKVNQIDYHPPYVIDTWAIPNIQEMHDRVKQFIQADDLRLVEQAMGKYAEIPVEKLPHCFVHGDFTKTNIIKGSDGKVYILDFSVANWYPRVQELAVISANLLHDEKNPDLSLREKTEVVAEEYNRLNTLTPEERQHLYAYSLAGVAMEFMGSHQEKYINGNDTEETEFWFQLGREGLRQALI
jgi:Ser/Thr protein kinase RdoA (MazF antagonist)